MDLSALCIAWYVHVGQLAALRLNVALAKGLAFQAVVKLGLGGRSLLDIARSTIADLSGAQHSPIVIHTTGSSA